MKFRFYYAVMKEHVRKINRKNTLSGLFKSIGMYTRNAATTKHILNNTYILNQKDVIYSN